MRSVSRISIVCVGTFLSLLNAGAVLSEIHAGDHPHHHSEIGHMAPGLTLNQGKKWNTDTTLRQGMKKISDKVINAVPAYHHATLTKADADKLARDIHNQVNYLVANCKLEPEADATLHVLIGDLLTAASTLSREPLSPQGLPSIVRTLQQYPKYFAHPGWKDMTAE
jgi:hypothetical protein